MTSIDMDKQLCAEDQVQCIVQNVLKTCVKEATLKTTILHLNDYEGRTAQYTGLPISYVSNIQKDLPKYEANSQPFDVFERLLIINTLLNCYNDETKKFPQIPDIYDVVKQALKNTKDCAHFSLQMWQMGFNYKKTTTGHNLLIEDMRYTFERYHYLKKIERYKCENTNIYYIDERIIDKTVTFPKPVFGETSRTTSNLEDGYIFYHVFSDAALENSFLTNKKCKDTYMKWIDGLVNILEPKSLIVIDNHPIHGELYSETITPYHCKTDMIKWLIANNIPHSKKMNRAELFQLISRSAKHNSNNRVYSFDKFLEAHGFDVLRLPFGCLDLSPSSLFWKGLPQKKAIEIQNLPPVDFENRLLQIIDFVYSTSWKKLCKEVKNYEDQFIEIDAKIETALDKICTFDVNHIENAPFILNDL